MLATKKEIMIKTHQASLNRFSRNAGRPISLKLALGCLAVAAVLHTAMAVAQNAVPAKVAAAASSPVPSTAPVSTPQIEGKTIDGKAFKLAALKGKVVLVMFWSTGCAVCRDKMPELRTNYEGWADKPFELVAINTDTRMQDLMDYERIISRTVPMKQRFVQLWAGEGS